MNANEDAASPASDFGQQSNVIILGLVKTMTISCFRAHISQELRKVQKGARLLISDRDTPIAVVVPYRPTADPRLARCDRALDFGVYPAA